jgi:uncharacterized protein
MSQKVQIRLPFDVDLEGHLKKEFPLLRDFRLISRSLDARGASRGKKPVYNYQIDLIESGEVFEKTTESLSKKNQPKQMPLIIGAGPAGLFCALRLLDHGIKSNIIERGASANNRMKHIARHWRYGEFDSDNNVCFGEGGAGLFSDGKLITRVKSPFIQYVMNRFVDFGAPKEIAYESNPHLGSNKIRGLISKITDHLRENGCEIHYHKKMSELLLNSSNEVTGVKCSDGTEFKTNCVVLAVGHSAHDIYRHLEQTGVAMASKDFAVGVRVEHSRAQMDKLQFGDFSGHPALGTARYRLSWHDKSNDLGTYSFCMCPGGYVLSSGTDADGIVVNGMSNYARNSRWSNSALVVTVKNNFSTKEVLAGLDYQRQIEKRAFDISKKVASGKEVPAQTIEQFLMGKDANIKGVKHSCPSGIFDYDLNQVLPSEVTSQLKKALEVFNRQIGGFSDVGGVLMAPETRTSAPVTISRDKKTRMSLSHAGLFPCGEGAGYAGGITSAGIDGINIAESIIKLYCN